ncbi:hypothetical protein PUN28_016935 [Cardiocondyla obscurior]|uniref:Uncharacterized protein n=1 Tax=Cardiocondyla obscurior TaxID=286306 RepID=A0AAW2EPD9_9HYME
MRHCSICADPGWLFCCFRVPRRCRPGVDDPAGGRSEVLCCAMFDGSISCGSLLCSLVSARVTRDPGLDFCNESRSVGWIASKVRRRFSIKTLSSFIPLKIFLNFNKKKCSYFLFCLCYKKLARQDCIQTLVRTNFLYVNLVFIKFIILITIRN